MDSKKFQEIDIDLWKFIRFDKISIPRIELTKVLVSSSGLYLALIHKNKHIAIFDLQSKRILFQYECEIKFTAVNFSDDDKYIVFDSFIKLFF